MGRRSCTSCGANVPARPASCPYCGAALAQAAALDVPRWATRNWGVLVVLLGAVNVVIDVYLGHDREAGIGLVVLVVTWLAWWALVGVTVAAAVVRVRARRASPRL
jgi:hypothetical protein